MTLAATTIATNISNLVVSGVTIADLNEIKEAPAPLRDLPLMQPRPDGFMTDLQVVRQSFGAGSGARKDVSYTLNYVYMHAPVMGGRNVLFDSYKAMVTNVNAILDAVLGNDDLSNTIDFSPQELVVFGLVVDPAGNSYHGAALSFRVLEFWS